MEDGRHKVPGAGVVALVEILKKPLAFAGKDDFALIAKVKDLGRTARRIIADMEGAPDLDEHRESVTRLSAIFTGYDELSVDEKKRAVSESLAIIADMTAERGPKKITGAAAPPPAGPAASARPGPLETPVEYVKGVGPRRAELLARRGIQTVEDLLFLFPLYYVDFRKLKKIRELSHNEQAALFVEVVAGGEKFSRRTRKRIFELVVTDGRDLMTLVWFNAPYMKGRFKNGDRLLVRGTAAEYNMKKSMAHPDVEPWDEEEEYRGALVGRYPLTEGLTLKSMVRIVRSALVGWGDLLPDGVPEGVRERLGLIPVKDAVRKIHEPADDEPALADGSYPPVKSLAMDELFIMELGLLMRKRNIIKAPGRSFKGDGRLVAAFLERLPFPLTGAQRRVLAEVTRDMRSPHPTHRLVQGDVGSGKTVVACAAALVAVEDNAQAALMAPTEILAEQHFRNLRGILEDVGVRSALLTSSVKTKDRREVLGGIGTGRIDILFGTHALISEGVEFRDLGLVVVDEQHRFGVLQRGALKEKGRAPEMIVMTATPIPRTLALTVYGDLDVSVIDEMPPGRVPPTTLLFPETGRGRAYEIIRSELARGRQAFFVYPLVEESEALPLKDATRMAAELTKAFPEYRVGLITGRLKGDKKQEIMGGFARGEINILVATTVVEVGVDVPNATVMVIEHAERYGLSQLHQLRGRIGRGGDRSYCILLADFVRTTDAQRRLEVMCRTTDGFVIAEEDLKIRGPGEFMGTRQSGLPTFRAVDLVRDYQTLLLARKEAERLIEEDPTLADPAHRVTREVLMDRLGGRLSLIEIG